MYLVNLFNRRMANQFFSADDGGGSGGDSNSTTETITTTETSTEEQKTEPKTVSKELFDKTASELAEKKRQLAEREKRLTELENAGKTAEQLKADELIKIEQLLKEKTLALSNATAISETATAKATIGLDNKDKTFDEVVNLMVNEDNELTATNSSKFSKLLIDVYNKGKTDALKDEHSKTADGIKTGGGNSSTSEFAKFQEKQQKSTEYVELKK